MGYPRTKKKVQKKKVQWEDRVRVITCSGEDKGEGEEGVQEETTGLVRGCLLSATAPKANSTVVDLRRLKTGFHKHR